MCPKSIRTCLIMFAGVLVFESLSVAGGVTGVCSDCHTMHNSQNGTTIVVSGTDAAWNGGGITGGDTTASQENLLVSNCVGCHSNTGSETIVTLGATKIPIVFNTSEPTQPLAGGNFYWVRSSGDAYGHNVAGISNTDSVLSSGPPGSLYIDGWPSAMCTPCHMDLSIPESASWSSWGVNKGGCEACHVPRHHAYGTNPVAGQEEGWYRFLGSAMYRAEYDDMVTPTGVVGIEDDDWEQTVSDTDHNVYQGAVGYVGAGAGSGLSEGSIGQICVGCHGQFHHVYAGIAESGMTDVSGAWIRHPADVLIPDTGEYADFNTYIPLTPVGLLNVTFDDANFQTLDKSRTVVNCISCHRVHGSPYPDMLRWDYLNDCKADTPNSSCGCFSCHTTKD